MVLYNRIEYSFSECVLICCEPALLVLSFLVWAAQVVFGTMVDQIRSVVLLILVNYFILALWRVFGKPTILMMLGCI